MTKRHELIGGFALAVLLAFDVGAQQTPADLAELRGLLEEQGKQLAAERRALEEQEARLAQTRRALAEHQRRLDALQAQISGGSTKRSSDSSSGAAPEPATPTQVGQAPESGAQAPEIPALVEARGVLTPRNTLILEPSMQYSHSSSSRVALLGFSILPALTIGQINISRVNRDTFIANLAARYGITNRLELEARVPYVYRDDSTTSRPLAAGASTDSVFNANGSDIGDVEVAARYQLNEGGFERPYYVGGLRFKTRTGKEPFEVPIDPNTGLETKLPTGSGFYALQPSVAAIFPSDPIVLFGSISYLWNIERSVNGADIDPGDAIGVNFGMGLALNEKSSFSISYDHSSLRKTQVNGVDVPLAQTTQIGLLGFGFSYRITDRSNLNLTLGTGVTEEAPDLQLTLRLPTTF